MDFKYIVHNYMAFNSNLFNYSSDRSVKQHKQLHIYNKKATAHFPKFDLWIYVCIYVLGYIMVTLVHPLLRRTLRTQSLASFMITT